MDLTTTYMGLTLPCPIVAGAGPLSRDVAGVEALAEAGAGAVVMHSIFEEQLAAEAENLDYYLSQGDDAFAEATTHFPAMQSLSVGPEEYLDHISDAKRRVDVPVIGSLNGVSAGGWTEYARRIADAGADALELNVYFLPTSPSVGGARVEAVYVNILQVVKAEVPIPVAVKISPFFTATANLARTLDENGADGLVMFNRFYQPDVDVAELEVRPRLALSTSEESRLPLRWIAILHKRVRASLIASSGVHTGEDAAKLILAGADAVQTVSSLLVNGPAHIATIRDEMVRLLEQHEYASIAEARGVLSLHNTAQPAAFERANYMKTLQQPWK